MNAITLVSPAGVTAAAIVGTSSALIIGVNPTRAGLYLFNPNNTAIIWVCPSTGPQTPLLPLGAPLAAVVGGAGSIPVQPLQGIVLGPPVMGRFVNGLNAIATAPSSPLTIWEFYA